MEQTYELIFSFALHNRQREKKLYRCNLLWPRLNSGWLTVFWGITFPRLLQTAVLKYVYHMLS